MNAKIFCRIISDDFSVETEMEIVHFFRDVLGTFGAKNIGFEPIRPYYKIDGYGEMVCTFFLDEKLTVEVCTKLASVWQCGVADARWSEIFCPRVNFLWLEAE